MYVYVLILYVIHNTIFRVAITTTLIEQIFLGMRDWLSSFDWAADFDSTDVPSMWNCFADRFTEALNKFVPISKPRKYKTFL